MKKQNTRRTQRSAAKTDRTSVILNLFREAPNNKFPLKHLCLLYTSDAADEL